MKFRLSKKGKRVGLALVLAWLLVAGIASFLPAWSQTTYTAEFYPVDDAYVDADSPDANYGAENILIVGSVGSERIYLKFNLSDFTLPVERIVSIKLKIYVITANSPSINRYVYYVENDTWSEEAITWNSQPGYDTSSQVYFYNLEAGNYKTIDITSLVISKISENDKILSLAIIGQSSDYEVQLASKEYAEADKWPRLLIEYEPYTETQTETITETVTVTETTTETITETVIATTTVTDVITETQTTTVTQTDVIYTTETAYTTETSTITETITDVITETATTTVTETHTEWANETVTVTTTITPTTTVTEYGNSTASEINYQALADALMPIIMVVGVICTMLSLILSATSSRRGD